MRTEWPAPGWFAGEPVLRRTTAFAAAVWLVVHLVYAVSSAGAVERWWSYVAGLVLWGLGSALALRTLGGPLTRAAEARDGVVMALLVPTVSLLDVASLQADQVGSYGNWANGGTAVMLAALVLRRHVTLAVAAGGALLLVQCVVALASGAPASATATLLVPVPLWLLGSWAVGDHVRRSGLLAASLRARRAAAATERLLSDRWAQLRGRHWADLEDEVLPLLRAVAALPEGEEVGAGDRAGARQVAGHMRDALLARSLMTRALRRQVQSARARGVRVLLHNALEDGPAVHALRDLVGNVLEIHGLERVSVRTFLDPGQATVVLRGDASFASYGREAVTTLTGTGLAWWQQTEVHELDGDVMVQLSGPYVD